MQSSVWLVVASAALGSACYVGPSEAELDCYRGCSTKKDACILEAMTAPQIQACDRESARCKATCQ